MPVYRRYGVADTIYFPMIKRAVVDFAVAADWTPVQSDCRIQIDAASASYATNLVTATGSRWALSMTAGELSGKKIGVYIVDAATKAVEDQDIEIESYGSPLAQWGFDFSVPTVTLSQGAFDQLVNEVWATPSRTLSAIDDKVIATSAVFKFAAGVWATPSAGQAVNQLADVVLRRSYTTAHATTSGDALTGRSLLGAVAKLVNLVQVNGANLEIMHEDDATVFITQAITTNSAAAPITKLDTV